MAFDFKRGDIINIKGDSYTVVQRDPDNLLVVLMNTSRANTTNALEKIDPRP